MHNGIFLVRLTLTIWQKPICRKSLSINATARLLDRMILRGARLTKPVRLYMVPRMCVYLSADVASPGDHKSRCRMENGVVMAHKEQSLLDTQ